METPVGLPGITLRNWLSLLLPGDWLVVILGLILVVISYPLLWRGGSADRVIVRRDGELIAELPLTISKKIEVIGPMGTTVIEVAPGRARVLSDPGLRQYCVKQGWLTRANAIAICAPNHVSLALAGHNKGAVAHDSITY
jgi:hypothetical protein